MSLPIGLSNYIRRLWPFVLAYVSFQELFRVILVIIEYSNVKASPLRVLYSLIVGLVFDIFVGLYVAIPYVIYLLFLPKKMYQKSTDILITNILFFGTLYTSIFTFIMELCFWTDLKSRFNFIAVDYLVYTKEVVNNILDSYPIPQILLSIGITCLVIAYFTHGYLFKVGKNNKNSVSLIGRFSFLGSIVCLLYAGHCFLDQKMTDISDNRYINDVSKNGLYSFVHAFLHNEMEYERFYVSMFDGIWEKDKGDAVRKMRNIVRREINAEDSLFTGSDINIERVRYNYGEEEKRYNVVVIVMESMAASFMDSFNEQKRDLTPNLDHLASQSVLFKKAYAVGTRTVHGLEAVALSAVPTPGQSIVRRKNNDNLFSIGWLFKDRGYDTRFIYGGFGYFDNMNTFFNGNGFSVVDRTDFKKEEITFANIWGVCDENLFEKVTQEADKSYNNKKSFMHVVMTTSNHRPYTYPDGKVDIPSHSSREGAVKYADYAIGSFFEIAKKKKWFNDTIFVIVADHTPYGRGVVAVDPKDHHIPWMIYAPKILRPKQINNIVSQLDVAPTVAGLLRFNYVSRFFGEDVLSNKVNRAFVRNYQNLGYMNETRLVVLYPTKKFKIYRNNELVKYDEDTKEIFKAKLVRNSVSECNLCTNARVFNVDGKIYFSIIKNLADRQKSDPDDELFVNQELDADYKIFEKSVAIFTDGSMWRRNSYIPNNIASRRKSIQRHDISQ